MVDCSQICHLNGLVKKNIYFFIQESYLTYFTPLIYHKVLINNNTEQDTEQDTTYRYDQRSRMPTPVAL